jgi:hypothetical protein
MKEVQLFEGNLVLDCLIPPILLNKVTHALPPRHDEFTPYALYRSNFEDRFTLGQKLFATPRDTE